MSGRSVTILASCVIMIGCDGGGDNGDSLSDPDAIGDTGDGGHDPGDAPDAGDTSPPDTLPDQDEVECASDGDCDDSDPCTADTCDLDYNTCDHGSVDDDDDGYPAASVLGTACSGGTDCDDGNGAIHPDAAPDCASGGDFDCDGDPDGDEDDDGHMPVACGGDDCDDADPDAFPGSLALDCALDRDCNDNPDDDNDGDGWDGVACGGLDCDDSRADVNPAAIEVNCNGIDDNCNGEMGLEEDWDQDDFPNATCAPAGAEMDCDDHDALVHPGAVEVCDAVDDDCDGVWAEAGADDDADGYLDEGCGGDDCDDADPLNHPGADLDADGYDGCGGDDCDDADPSVNPGAAVTCVAMDMNCNGNPDWDDDGDGQQAVACGGTDCRDGDASTLLGECAGTNPCCDGCWKVNGCWYDDTTGYLWQDPPPSGDWPYAAAVSYCQALSLAGRVTGSWHLPTISEERTLVRGCPTAEDGGACGVTDSCLINSCNFGCGGCDTGGGPGLGGCYWDPAVGGPCGWYMSSSTHGTYPTSTWGMGYDGISFSYVDKAYGYKIRCVSTGT